MKKEKKLLTVFLFILTIGSHAQSGIVTYGTKQYASENLQTDNERVIKIADELEVMQFTLKYTKEKSYFHKEKNLPKHSPYFAKMASVFAGANEDSFQFLATKEAYQNTAIASKKYVVDYSYRMKGWKLTEEVKKIDNYNCYKAILLEYNDRSDTYSEIIAWYAPQIPVPYGPAGYGGLPGLILQLQYRSCVYTVGKITFNPTKRVEIPNMEEGEKINQKQMVHYMRMARKVTVD